MTLRSCHGTVFHHKPLVVSWEFKLNERLMAHSLLLCGAKEKADRVLHRQQDARLLRVTMLKTHPPSTGEKAIGRRHLQLSGTQPSSTPENGKALKQTH